MKNNIILIFFFLILISSCESNLKNPLYTAVRRNKIDKVKKLIAEGIDINKKYRYDYTVLMIAAENGNLELVKYLVEKGADVQAVNIAGVTTLMFACSEKCNLEVVKYLVENGVDINKRDANGGNALIYISNKNKFEVVKYLVDKEIDINVKTYGLGFTPLFNAVKFSDFKTVKFLIENGADVNCKNNNGMTPLDYAEKSIKIDKAKKIDFLKKAGAKKGIELK